MSLLLSAIKRHDPARLALVGDTFKYTYDDLITEIEARKNILSGVSVLGLNLDNGPEWILWDLAALQAEIPVVPLPSFFTPEQTSHALRLAGVSHILSPKGLVATGLFSIGVFDERTAKITFTSGTTGAPKGVCLSAEGLEQVAQSIVEMLEPEIAGRHLSILPLSILLENVAGVYATLLAGGTIYLPSLSTIGFANPFQPDFTALIQYMGQHKITSGILVPELLRGLIQQAPILPDLKFLAVGGAKISPDLITAARKGGLPVYEGYGLSECGSVVSLNTPQHSRIGSVGKILPHIQIKQHKGELIILNPAFLGYLGAPHSGAFVTGDLGHIHENGFLYIEGRKKNVLITSYGRNISPEWIESLLLSQPEIAQAVVHGDAQPFLSALIAPASSADIVAAIERCNARLPEYAHVKDFKIVPAFTVSEGTLTATGRPRRDKIFQKHIPIMEKEKTHELLQTAG